MFRIGDDRVGIVTTAYSGVDELMVKVATGETVVWKDDCSFQLMTSTENQTDTTTTSLMARVVLPIDDDTRALVSSSVLRFPYPTGDDYVLRGNPFLEVDQRGREQYMTCDAERQTG